LNLNVIDTREGVIDHFAASLRLASVQIATGGDSLLALGTEALAMQHIISDMSTATHPPLAVVTDILRLLLYPNEVFVRPNGFFPEQAQQYRHNVLYALMRNDASVTEVVRVLQGRKATGWSRFFPFLVREVGHALNAVCAFPLRYDYPLLPTTAECRRHEPSRDALEAESTAMGVLSQAYPRITRLFTQEQVTVLEFLRDKADVTALRQYVTVLSELDPVSVKLARQACLASYKQVEVEDRRIPTMGGYTGLESGGSLEALSSMLPSEMAQMETTGKVDGFDIGLIEKRLLFFKRDQQIDVRQKRYLHFVFSSPQEFNFRMATVPVRWQYLFLAVLFDILRVFRDGTGIAGYDFYFVGGKNESLSRIVKAVSRKEFRCAKSVELCEDHVELKERIAERIEEYPDAKHTTRVLASAEKSPLTTQVSFRTNDHSDIVHVTAGNGKVQMIQSYSEHVSKTFTNTLRDLLLSLISTGEKKCQQSE